MKTNFRDHQSNIRSFVIPFDVPFIATYVTNEQHKCMQTSQPCAFHFFSLPMLYLSLLHNIWHPPQIKYLFCFQENIPHVIGQNLLISSGQQNSQIPQGKSNFKLTQDPVMHHETTEYFCDSLCEEIKFKYAFQ